ncbi:hypothetical protein LPTSP3_g32870 [Leptospira kobayashii]|uniref:Thioredoxin domain-containing protein n=1 Tax=Leptospira kobayashii TaxID=1917830 RepID=A0ABM7UTJ1_9LEPT|nr:thioredoxin family protein [Leptospira kobayashii]BDA80357.1 hypothetical protein LPTSP3_g32870 [Leptospira kobayashii]
MKIIANQHKTFTVFFIFSLFLSPSLFSQTDTSFQIQPNSNLEIKSGGSADITLDVFIPEDKHLYIKKASALSFNRPTEFSIQTKGFGALVKEAPSSEKKGDDFILQGKGSSKAGTYVLTIFETNGRSVSKVATNVVLEINTQWCITASEKCLEPKIIKKTLAVTISGEKQAIGGIKSRNTGGVQWISSLNSAKANAKSSKQNIFAIVTAPEWCGYCQHMENEVFSKDNVIKTLNSKFVPLQILDTSPDLNKFKFEGYPTMYILDGNGKVIDAELYGNNEKSFLAAIKKYESSPANDNSTSVNNDLTESAFTYIIKQEVKFKRNPDGSWNQIIGNSSATLTETSRDENYIILFNEKEKQSYALPLKGKKAYYLKNNKWEPFDLE